MLQSEGILRKKAVHLPSFHNEAGGGAIINSLKKRDWDEGSVWDIDNAGEELYIVRATAAKEKKVKTGGHLKNVPVNVLLQRRLELEKKIEDGEELTNDEELMLSEIDDVLEGIEV